LTEIMPPEVAENFHQRAMAIIRTYLRGDVEGLVTLTGDDADELLPMVTQVMVDVLTRLGYREMVEQQLDAWFEARLTG
jgi:hypothetical protein